MSLHTSETAPDSLKMRKTRLDDTGRKIGFEIGYDHAVYGAHIMENFKLDAESISIIEAGFLEGQRKFEGRPRASNIFIRKWLHLRISAWTRGRIFDEHITPDYLAAINVSICPITRMELTKGKLADSDWSVDRIINNAGYARGNLAVMSSKANLAKGTLLPDDILGIIRSGEARDGLTPIEWARMACMTAYIDDRRSVLPLLLMPPPKMLIANIHIPFQMMLMYSAAGYSSPQGYQKMRAAIPGKSAKRAMDEFFMLAIGKLRGADKCNSYQSFFLHAGDAWQDGKLMARFRPLIHDMGLETEIKCISLMRSTNTSIRNIKEPLRDEWGLDSAGYRKAYL